MSTTSSPGEARVGDTPIRASRPLGPSLVCPAAAGLEAPAAPGEGPLARPRQPRLAAVVPLDRQPWSGGLETRDPAPEAGAVARDLLGGVDAPGVRPRAPIVLPAEPQDRPPGAGGLQRGA